ncbi:hypothetical protein CYL21_3073 [Plasmodium falciparum NF54]|uniref:Uncharacterized protein n=2 Tax=Plasmodium falciparum TaxID=5833 RepID=O97233_PLAF7|nr:conserved Plasmodium protein, unknown function [Plasmodium falciparum 3D7]EWC90747.1 hypothetical protein PFNF54_00393 [Plasmodium falciparum NF54]KAF4328862.1 hypothetical protein CYL21_3073 [Plasmodium falciparum NF54]PKC45377.1 hypothetical protein CK202_3731 [Plasmodium falciparum NF54]CAB38999.3 conserved Plasmodium protein, unknown function [Plasmodium falciparum 3D7]|eukprot:XP_001351123.2 conserved Plasmodium protein, unknown function [Plasmodium falciparum 3D7]
MKRLFLLIYAITIFSIYLINGAIKNESYRKKKSLMSIIFGNLLTKYKRKKKSSLNSSKSESDSSVPTELEDQVNYEIYRNENISNEDEEDIARDECNKLYDELYEERDKDDNYEDTYDNNNYGMKKITNRHILNLHLGEHVPMENKKHDSVKQVILFQNYYKDNIINEHSNNIRKDEYSFNSIYHPKEKEKEKEKVKKRRPKSMDFESKSYGTFKEENDQKKKKNRWSTIGFSRKKINNFDYIDDINVSYFSYEEDNKSENKEKKYTQEFYGVTGIFAWTYEDALILNTKPTRTQSSPHITESNVKEEYEKKNYDDEIDLFYNCIKEEKKKREMEKEEKKQKEKQNIDLKNKNGNDILNDEDLLENTPHKEKHNYSCVTSNKSAYHEILENQKKEELNELKYYLDLLEEKKKENMEKINLRRSSSLSPFNTNENSNSDFHLEKNEDKKLMLNEKIHVSKDNISEYSCCIEYI